ncbi:MAG: transglycosylase SLT domain-containing protein [Acidobacteriota bacterium]|nr:transglycosylase SLT domain-containing protein [Acidobacteriota bacterium]
MIRKRRLFFAAIAAALIIVLVALGTLLFRERVQRRRVFHPAAGDVTPAPRGVPPVEQWTPTFSALDPAALDELLDEIETRHSDLYRKYSLAYLHARALAGENEGEAAAEKLAPFLEKSHPFRKLALYHRAAIATGAEASRYRTELIVEHADSIYRDETIDEELEYLASLGDPQPLIEFAAKVASAASTERRREMSARIVEAFVEENQLDAAFTRGLALLNGGNTDDAADRVSRALDRPEILGRLDATQLALFGETFQQHRHFDRAVVLLQMAIAKMPKPNPARVDELRYALGRSHFGAEQYGEAQAVYLRAANATAEPKMRATFFWHAARAEQLRNEDDVAEKLMTQAIAVKGNFPPTLAALTQRLRLRIKQRRLSDARADYTLIKRIAGNDRAFVEASLAFAVGNLAMDRNMYARGILDAVPRNLLNAYDRAEFAYWSARALEKSDPAASFRAYLDVLRAEVPAHFAYFARTRLDSPAMTANLARELAVREAQVSNLINAQKFDLAKDIQTDRILLSSRDSDRQLRILAAIYRELPTYRTVLELAPKALPRFPTVDVDDPDALLMAMGLHDEAVPAIEKRFPLAPAREALSRSYALHLGAASRPSIYAIEVMMKRVPNDYHPELLPIAVRQLLYPRYFYGFIVEDAKRYDSDPALLLSIMREESRFNPRAKSQAAARGLLQFIITTARDIGRDVGLVDVDPEDLYDPRVIIRLGAKYVSELGEQFDGNRYRISAAYNAGPKQVALWTRTQPAEGDDYFLTAVSFDETKHYIRKVMNSYERYSEIYGESGPKGGLRVEP